jgi:hypothetical protein
LINVDYLETLNGIDKNLGPRKESIEKVLITKILIDNNQKRVSTVKKKMTVSKTRS